MRAQELVEEVDEALLDSPPARPGGSLLVMVGLPGAGKSYILEKLQALVPFGIVTTDKVRLHVRPEPLNTAAEVAYTYEICYGVVNRRLERGVRVAFDGSNYLAARRERLFALARRHGAPLAVCYVQASEAVTRQRLNRRMAGRRHRGDWSDAGWSVYQWMVEAQEPLAVPHLILDTSATPPEVLAADLYDYWMAREREIWEKRERQEEGGGVVSR